MKSTFIQGVILAVIVIAFPIFIMIHSSIVEIDFEACFANLGDAVNGHRPSHVMVADMKLAYLASEAIDRVFSSKDMLTPLFGFWTFIPFVLSWWSASKMRMRVFWVISAIVSVVIIIIGVYLSSLSDFYACDRKGVSLAIIVAPIFLFVINSGFVMAALAVRSIYDLWLESRSSRYDR